MKGTFSLPDGSKVRVASQRRYVVVGTGWNNDDRFRVWSRSDSKDTILSKWRHYARKYTSATFHVIDTAEGEVIR